MRALRLSLLVAGACVSASTVRADGLGEKAAEAKAARAVKAASGGSRVYTTEDLVETKTAVPAASEGSARRRRRQRRAGSERRGPRPVRPRPVRATSPPGSAWVAARVDRALRVSSSTTETACWGRENRDDGEARSRSPAAWALRNRAPILPHGANRPTARTRSDAGATGPCRHRRPGPYRLRRPHPRPCRRRPRRRLRLRHPRLLRLPRPLPHRRPAPLQHLGRRRARAPRPRPSRGSTSRATRRGTRTSRTHRSTPTRRRSSRT